MNWRPLKFSIRAKLSLFIIVVAALFALILYGFVVPLIEQEKRSEREGTLKAVVESAVSLMKYYEDGIRTYQWKTNPTFPKNREEAQARVLHHLREVRYGENEHIFILDGSVQMIMHPLKPALEGSNMADVQAPDGSFPFKQMAYQAQLKTNVFISYNWLSKWSQSIKEPQTTYAQYFYPWSWVICSSLYTQDIDDVVRAFTLRLTLYFSIGLMIVWGILYFTGLLLINPILSLAQQVRKAEEQPTVDTSDAIAVQSTDEIGELAEAFKSTLQSQHKVATKLRISEARFRDFAENGADWFWETDVDRKFTYIAGRVEEVTGWKPEQIIGKTREEIYKDNREVSSLEFQRNIDLIAAQLPFSNFEVNWYRPDDEVRIISISGKPIINRKDEFVGYRGVGRDITQQKQLEEQVQRAQKMEAIGELTSGIAHDFNNVLGIIQGNLEILKETISLNKENADRIDKAQRGLDRGTNITRKLLSFSRKDAKQLKLTAVNEFIENLEDLIAKSITASITVETLLSTNLWSVAIDPGDLEDALLNLSLNARDAMPDGGTLTIQTSNKKLDSDYVRRNPSAHKGEYVQISVSDTGCGMAESVQEKVLEPFFTTKAEGKGTGLGLSMVYGFIKRSGGHLKIYSEIGNGTVFHLYLPRAQGVVSDPANTENRSRLPTGSETILVVEDEEDLRDIAISYLETLGYETLSASNGNQALAVIKNGQSIDLVFSDVVMPGGLNGLQLASSVHEQHPLLKFLLTSGYTRMRSDEHESYSEFEKKLTRTILNKPYSKSELAFALRGILDTPQDQSETY